MTNSDHDSRDRLQELFEAALECSGGQRGEFVAQACSSDADLKSELEGFLRVSEQADEVLEPSADGGVNWLKVLQAAPTGVPRQIGHYSIQRVIASGGMGTVYEAEQQNPKRTVVLKVMRWSIASTSAKRRFQYESELLAWLRHPGIAQVFEAGTHKDGSEELPYFAMEYVPDAKPITEYADEQDFGLRQRLELFAEVCDAVHYGHQKGIIHRDLKPGNILVDVEGQPRIIDFGVARATDSDMALTSCGTQMGELIGTLQYMSPEQCAADPNDLDTRSDVYALGVVLYELLTNFVVGLRFRQPPTRTGSTNSPALNLLQTDRVDIPISLATSSTEINKGSVLASGGVKSNF